MLRALIEKIYCFINDLLLTDEKIKEILDKKLHALLDDNKADTYAVCWDKFDETITALVEGAEPNVTAAIRRGIRYLNPLKVKEEIEGVAKHEAYHVLQFLYVFEHGGAEALDKLFADVEQCDYWDNVLEKGAYLYQCSTFSKIFPVTLLPILGIPARKRKFKSYIQRRLDFFFARDAIKMAEQTSRTWRWKYNEIFRKFFRGGARGRSGSVHHQHNRVN